MEKMIKEVVLHRFYEIQVCPRDMYREVELEEALKEFGMTIDELEEMQNSFVMCDFMKKYIIDYVGDHLPDVVTMHKIFGEIVDKYGKEYESIQLQWSQDREYSYHFCVVGYRDETNEEFAERLNNEKAKLAEKNRIKQEKKELARQKAIEKAKKTLKDNGMNIQ